MGVPVNYRKIGEGAIATYDFVDIASGTGYIDFYAGACETTNSLSNVSFYSDYIFNADYTNDTNNFIKKVDLDFDVLINKPIVLKGKAIVNVPYGAMAVNDTAICYAVARVRKWDGTTETEIANSSNSLTITGTGAAPTFNMAALDITLPLTKFKKGEYLRLTIEGWVKATAGGANQSYIVVALDPKGRLVGRDQNGSVFSISGEVWDATGAYPTTLNFLCPVRIDL